MPGDLLRNLMSVPTSATVRSDGTATLRSPLPEEVLFESLATRVWAFSCRRTVSTTRRRSMPSTV
jgi:hypothetical protein